MTPRPIPPLAPRALAGRIGLALAIAAVVLAVGVLPAEYGIDPTGAGRRLGLTDLYAAEAAPPVQAGRTDPAPSPAAASGLVPGRAMADGRDAVGQPVKPVLAGAVRVAPVPYHEDTVTVILAPGKGSEMKTHLKAGQGMVYRWSASAPVASDLHGERAGGAEGDYTSYRIEPPRDADTGMFVAPFDGVHGWYWLNRGDIPVRVELHVAGFHDKLFRPGHP